MLSASLNKTFLSLSLSADCDDLDSARKTKRNHHVRCPLDLLASDVHSFHHSLLLQNQTEGIYLIISPDVHSFHHSLLLQNQTEGIYLIISPDVHSFYHSLLLLIPFYSKIKLKVYIELSPLMFIASIIPFYSKIKLKVYIELSPLMFIASIIPFYSKIKLKVYI